MCPTVALFTQHEAVTFQIQIHSQCIRQVALRLECEYFIANIVL